MSSNLREFLDPVASWFSGLGMPEPLIHWGHPLMMGIVVFVMGSFVGLTGWRIRVSTESDVMFKARQEHRVIAPLMFAFMAMGYTGGLLSLVMQDQPLLESPHFWTGTVVLLLLAVNGAIALLGFGKSDSALRTAHAYLGSVTLCVMFLHALLGLKLGLSI